MMHGHVDIITREKEMLLLNLIPMFHPYLSIGYDGPFSRIFSI